MLTVLYGLRKIKYPTQWSEVSPATIGIFVREFFQQRDKLFEEDPNTGRFFHKDMVAYDYLRTLLLQSMLGLTNAEFNKIGIPQRHYLLNKKNLVSFLFETEMQHQPIPKIKRPLGAWFGPVDFNKITAEEFSFADAACTNYIKTRNPQMLNTLVAVLYRPGKWLWKLRSQSIKTDGDRRQDFNKHLIDKRLKVAEKLPLDTKLSVFWWFQTQRANLPARFPSVFTTGNESSADKYGWLTVILSLSSNGPFGNFEQTKATPFHMVLTDLDARAAQHQKQQQ